MRNQSLSLSLSLPLKQKIKVQGQIFATIVKIPPGMALAHTLLLGSSPIPTSDVTFLGCVPGMAIVMAQAPATHVGDPVRVLVPNFGLAQVHC